MTVSFSDSIRLIRKQVRCSPKGVSLLTKWPFRVGAEVEFAFDHQGERHCCTGVVVACHPMRRPLGFYETVLFFVETPCSTFQKAASDCRLVSQAISEAASNMQEEESRDGTTSSARVRSPNSRR